MHKIKNYEKNKLNFLKLNIILTQMGFFNDIKKKIAFTAQSFSNKKNKQERISDKENSIDFHLELTKKIDDIIE
ncbi:MAG: hypothetical protein QHH15_06260, partial [Candidatus Thermoplasmatota archaeon]|nr:hypothetical protein [Candidatus Thermoplasmatota archaeon]